MVGPLFALFIAFLVTTHGYSMVSVSHVALDGEDPSTVISNSLIMYEEDVSQASSMGASMIIFPEFGLGGSYIDRSTIEPYCGQVPSLGSQPCSSTDNTSFSVVTQASCMAQKYKIIVVINTCQVIPCNETTTNETCPDDGRFQYNTEIVMDETGTLVAVYHKSHPFYFNCFDTPDPFDVISFNTSFGIEFGIFTCLDIAFESPSKELYDKGIRHYAYSSSIPNVTANFAFTEWTTKYSSTLHISNLGHSVGGVYVNGTHLPYTTTVLSNGDELLFTQL